MFSNIHDHAASVISEYLNGKPKAEGNHPAMKCCGPLRMLKQSSINFAPSVSSLSLFQFLLSYFHSKTLPVNREHGVRDKTGNLQMFCNIYSTATVCAIGFPLQLMAQHLALNLTVIRESFDSWFVKHSKLTPCSCSLRKGNIKWPSLGWVIPDLPLKRLGADALCQLMFRVMPVSLKESLMRPRQARCAQLSGDGNLKANRSTRAALPEKKRKDRSSAIARPLQEV